MDAKGRDPAATLPTSCWEEILGLEVSQRFYDASGIRTRCIETGKGPCLIFIHGTGGHAEAFVKNLRSHGQHFRTIALDMVGHGFSDKPDVDYTLPIYARHLRDFLDAAGIERAHVHGESLGAWIAAWFALEYPDRVERLVLNTAGGLRSDPTVMAKVRDSTLEAVRNVTCESVRRRLEWLVFDKASMTDEMVAIRFQIYSQPGMVKAMEHVLCLQDEATRRPYLLTPDRLAEIRHRTLVLWTSHDPTAPVEVGREAARHIPDSEFVVMEDCGHWPQFEKPDEFNRIHLNFLLRGSTLGA
jgi:2-hydroxy-6-oxonona-2,4-dienedioate hydrolase